MVALKDSPGTCTWLNVKMRGFAQLQAAARYPKASPPTYKPLAIPSDIYRASFHPYFVYLSSILEPQINILNMTVPKQTTPVRTPFPTPYYLLPLTITQLDPNSSTPSHTPWRRDLNGVSHLGRDGVLRSLNADRTVVLDVRRLSPQEIKDIAGPADQATRDALEGVDGRDVVDERVLWAVPEDQKGWAAGDGDGKEGEGK